MPAAHNRYAVIIVGAGPTGLTLANLLGRRGVPTLLVERHLTTVQEPRAVSIDDESLRTMQAAGAIDAVLSEVVAGYGSDYLSPSGRRFLSVAPREAPYGYPRRNAFRQPTLEAQLRDNLMRYPSVTALFGHSLVDLTQNAGGVSLTLATENDGEKIVEGDYLVGADGASSRVRDFLGFKLAGESFSERWLIVDLENSPVTDLQTKVFCDARRPCIALPGPKLTRRFEFKLHAHETTEEMTDPTRVKMLLDTHGADPASVIRRKTVYGFHALVAPQWSKGRVFLAGDACHLTPPFAGQGMNSGIRDAHNLAWKLAEVHAGRSSPDILASYQTERRPHVRQMIDLALRMGRVMGPSSPWRGFATRCLFRGLSLWPPAKSYLAEMRYKPKPFFRQGFLIQPKPRRFAKLVGRLTPQPRLMLQDGSRVLLDDMLGDDFGLLVIGAAPSETSKVLATWSDAPVPLVRIAIIDQDGPTMPGIELASDPDGAFSKMLGSGSALCLLVRPDRYVMAAFPPSEAGQVLADLKRLLGRAGLGSSPSIATPLELQEA